MQGHIAAAITAMSVGVALIPASWSLAAAITVWAVGMWATNAWLPQVTTLAFFLLVILAGVAPPAVVLSGFESSAWWLIFSGLIVGIAVTRTGLAERIVRRMAAVRARHYSAIIGSMVLIGLVLTFLVPSSMGRTVMLMPIALAYAQALGYAPGSRAHTGIAMAAVLGAYLPSAGVLPANLPNVILAAAAESQYQRPLNYAEYLLLHFPVIGAVKAALMVGLLVLFFYERAMSVHPQMRQAAPWSRDERLLAGVLAISVGLWMTDFLHHVSPAWVGLAAAVVCLVPYTRLVPSDSLAKDVSWNALIHAAGVIGLGAVVAHSGLGEVLGRWLVSVAPFDERASLWNFWLVSTIATLICLVTTTTGVPAVMTPLSGTLAEASGLSLDMVLMSQAIGFSNVLFPYEGAPLVFAIGYARLSITQVTKVLLLLGAATIALLTPLTYAWWVFLGL
jgi:di/tricarboxylate transporter